MNWATAADFGVDYSQLRSWLGLVPGAWPPDHYALLGLSPGSCDPAAIERLVLARMGQLRPHQILHPELVTEGMNRLAQALICLTDPVMRAAYDLELGIPPKAAPVKATPPKPVPPPLPIPPPRPPRPLPPPLPVSIPTNDQPTGRSIAENTQISEVRFEPGLAPPEPLPPAYEVVEYEVVEPEPPRPALGEPKTLPYEVVWEAAVEPPALDEGAVEAELIAPPAALWQPATRRQLYARLALVRRLIAVWEQLKPVLGDPRDPIDRPARVLALLEAVANVRPLLDSLPGLFGEFGHPGGLVATIVRQPLALSMVRVLLPDQRRAIAIDWRQAERTLVGEQVRLRELARSGRPTRRRSRTRKRLPRQFAGWLMRTPEAILLVLAVAALIATVVRSRSGPWRF